MSRDAKTTERLQKLLTKLIEMTQARELHWEKQLGSAHRYARWNNNLLILGPAASEPSTPRYLFITPFDSPACIEINSEDADLGTAVRTLSQTVEATSAKQPATDPFAISQDLLDRLT